MTQRSIRNTAKARKPAAEPAEDVPATGPVEPTEPAEPAEPTELGEPAELAEPAEPAELAEPGEAEGMWMRPPAPRVPPLPIKERLKRIPPGVAILTLAAVLALGFLLYEIASRTASVQILTSAGLVCGMVYAAVTVACGAATWRLGHEGRLWAALLVAFIGGCAAFVSAGSFAGALVLFLALGF